MKNQELFDRTVGILVKAYLNDTLQHQFCACCAVGNLVSANMGYVSEKGTNYFNNYGVEPSWTECTYNGKPKKLRLNDLSDLAKAQINSTGYTPREIHLIEKSFESVIKNSEGNVSYEYEMSREDNNWQYLGLMSVCDALMKIHEASEFEVTAAKSLFKKELAEVG